MGQRRGCAGRGVSGRLGDTHSLERLRDIGGAVAVSVCPRGRAWIDPEMGTEMGTHTISPAAACCTGKGKGVCPHFRWTITFARVLELGLDRRWKSDWLGGWAAFLDETADGGANDNEFIVMAAA